MCIIIDANVAHEFCPVKGDAVVVFAWLTEGGGVMAVGGRLKQELLAIAKFRAIYRGLLLAGRLYQYDDGEVGTEEGKVSSLLILASDDPHVIALARVSHCRVLFSRDRDLHQDFTTLTC